MTDNKDEIIKELLYEIKLLKDELQEIKDFYEYTEEDI